MKTRYTQELPDKAIFAYSNFRYKNCEGCGDKTRFYEDVGVDVPLCSHECGAKYWQKAMGTLVEEKPRKLT